jgi:hypothetical protein
MISPKNYDAALSFAGEQRTIARGITRQLSPLGYSIFYDEYNTNETWGEDLSELFHAIYSKTKFIIMLVSKQYLEKAWTRQERRAAIENSMENSSHLILQIKIDKVDVPGISKLFGYNTFDGDLNKLCAALIEKLGPKTPPLVTGAGIQAKEVLRICSRRSIFTSMDSEISTEKMFNSIETCIGSLNSYIPDITDKSLSQYVKSIITDLDNLDRYSEDAPYYSIRFDGFAKKEMDSLKITIIDKLHYLNVKFGVGIDLPNDIGLDYEISRNRQLQLE